MEGAGCQTKEAGLIFVTFNACKINKGHEKSCSEKRIVRP